MTVGETTTVDVHIYVQTYRSVGLPVHTGMSCASWWRMFINTLFLIPPAFLQAVTGEVRLQGLHTASALCPHNLPVITDLGCISSILRVGCAMERAGERCKCCTNSKHATPVIHALQGPYTSITQTPNVTNGFSSVALYISNTTGW